MMPASTQTRLLAIALCALGVSVGASQVRAADAKAAPPAAGKEANAKAAADAIAQREKIIKEYDALQKQLKEATEEQKKAILAKMEKAFAEMQAAVRKQVQEDMRKRRQNAGPRR